ncbi:hypothetical protein F8388_006553 [Cannabis sativa]|uniref:Uncharacterized protein n=1 Tax=Cannabis sativa TaxID=3483 RepID=A0A7J6GV08_CANSA|nr:hypothetical protein F8388_006553 [Cannabis sativa]
MNIRTRIFHGVPHTSLSCQVHHMGESHNLEKLLQQGRVINISFHDKHPGSLQKRLPSSFQRRIIVIVKAIESKHSVSTAFQSRGHAAPPQLYVLRERREGSDGKGLEGDRKKKRKIRPKKTKDQNVSLAREECHRSLFLCGDGGGGGDIDIDERGVKDKESGGALTIARIMWVVEAQYYLGSQDK